MSLPIDGPSADLDVRLRGLLDRQDIYDALVRYCRGIDRCDVELVLSAFHDDALDNHVGVDQSVAERVPRVIEKAKTDVEWTSHNLCNVLIELDGDIATSESYLVAYHRIARNGGLSRDAHQAGEVDWILGARYVDRFERRSGVWRIAHRTVIYDWDRFDDVPERPRDLAEATFAANALHACRSPDDYSYRRITEC